MNTIYVDDDVKVLVYPSDYEYSVYWEERYDVIDGKDLYDYMEYTGGSYVKE